ncbi:histidine phosphatase family protein [Neorhizobium lilium]|uniref:Histidine phosphatase family protein n=1 Tax=Neorhizobium lilium TaxID=2503024 RepID=A0A3S3VSL0_9HYPH|nr:histidine phosphatase family protein [Neorhizobium lilium]RWX80978.1 histidine phosphatase family protein [Neorhizobium lilium]
MTNSFPEIHLVRHGETEWTVSGRHTGRTDIDLTAKGEEAARGLADRLRGTEPPIVWSSPSLRALRTCELAGFSSGVVVKPDLHEWDYGDYEGVTTKEILQSRPGWQLFHDGAPGGESAVDVGARADRVIAELRLLGSSALIFSSSHFLRVLAARWLDLPPEHGESFILGTASISILGYEHNLEEPVIRAWNLG